MEERNRKIAFALPVVRVILGIVFVYAGASKAFVPDTFFHDINNYHMLPAVFAYALAWFLPWLEIVLGIALILNKLVRGAVLLLLMLLSVFTLGILSALVRGLNIECGCFGSGLSMSLWWSLFRNIMLIAVTWVLFAATKEKAKEAS